MAFDLAGAVADHMDFFHGQVEGVQIVSRRKTGDLVFKPASCFREEVTRIQQAPSFAVYQRFNTIWHVKTDLLPGIALKPGDKLIAPDDGTLTMLTTGLETLRTRWELNCLNLALVHDLSSLLDYWAPSGAAKDGAGVLKRLFMLANGGLQGRVQEMEGDLEELRDKRGTVKRYTIYLEDQLDLSADGYFKVQGQAPIYSIERWTNKERIDDLLTIEAKVEFDGN